MGKVQGWLLVSLGTLNLYGVVVLTVLLGRTVGLREVVRDAQDWREAHSAGLRSLKDEMRGLTQQALETSGRADRIEHALEALDRASKESHGVK